MIFVYHLCQCHNKILFPSLIIKQFPQDQKKKLNKILNLSEEKVSLKSKKSKIKLANNSAWMNWHLNKSWVKFKILKRVWFKENIKLLIS